MARFEPLNAQIERLGSLLFIAAQKPGGLFDPEKFLRDHAVSFPFLLDKDRQVSKSYGVYRAVSFDSINIARPATLVIDRSGIARFVYVGAHQADRPPVEQVLAALSSAA